MLPHQVKYINGWEPRTPNFMLAHQIQTEFKHWDIVHDYFMKPTTTTTITKKATGAYEEKKSTKSDLKTGQA